MKQVIDDVVAFHRRFSLLLAARPTLLSAQAWQLRSTLLQEELAELEQAYQQADPVKIADGLLDAIFVLVGTAVSSGLDLGAMWPAVVEANMAKTEADESGKPTKPDGWVGPEAWIAEIIQAGTVRWEDKPEGDQ